MAAFRAVENRAYLVRAANTGISAIVAPDGRIVQASRSFTREVVSGAIAQRIGLSVYTRYGDVFAWATVAVALAVMWPVTRTRRVEMHPNRGTEFVLEDQAGRLDGRRGLVASLVAGTTALAAAVWGWRLRSADGRGYEEIARWQIPGGQGRFIVVDVDPAADALRAVGERLRQELEGVDSAVVMVFDDAAAARAVRQGSRVVGEERFQAALAHQRAMYTKQTARGEHALVVYTRYPEVAEGSAAPLLGARTRRTSFFRQRPRGAIAGQGVWKRYSGLARPGRPIPERCDRSNGRSTGWHLPAAYQAALESEILHDLEHLSFFGGALLFWWPVVHPAPRVRPLHYGFRLLYLAAAVALTMVPAMVVTLFVKRVIYTHYATTPRLWGWSALDDQALARGLMGVVHALVYCVAFLTLVMRMALHEQRMTERQETLERQRAEAEIEQTTAAGGRRRW